MKQTDSNIDASFWGSRNLQVRYTLNFQQQTSFQFSTRLILE